jgi:hypothetical protein
MTKKQLQIIDDACLAVINKAAANGATEVRVEDAIAQISAEDLRYLKTALVLDWLEDQVRALARELGLTLREK